MPVTVGAVGRPIHRYHACWMRIIFPVKEQQLDARSASRKDAEIGAPRNNRGAERGASPAKHITVGIGGPLSNDKGPIKANSAHTLVPSEQFFRRRDDVYSCLQNISHSQGEQHYPFVRPRATMGPTSFQDVSLVFRYLRIKLFVELSWLSEGSPSLSSSGMMRCASALPSSTPHWSNELICQMAPCVKTECS